MYLDLIAKEQRGSGTAHVSQDELETWEVLLVAVNVAAFAEILCLQVYARVRLLRCGL